MKSLFNSAIPYIVALVLFISTFESLKLYYNEKQTTTRLTDDLAAEQNKGEYFKARNGDQAAKIQSQDLTITELRKISPSIIADLHNLYIPPRLLNSYTEASTKTDATINAALHDSIIDKKPGKNMFAQADSAFNRKYNKDSVVRVFSYADKWFTAKGVITVDSIKQQIHGRDTITTIPYFSRREHKFLFIRYGRRHPECIVSNKNPFNKITIGKSVIIKK